MKAENGASKVLESSEELHCTLISVARAGPEFGQPC